MTARKAGALLALIAVAPLVFAAFTRGWMTASGEGETARFGLLSGEVCQEGRCDGGPWSEALSSSGGDPRARLVTYGGYAAVTGTLVLAALLVLVGVHALRKREGGALGPILVVVAALVGLAGALGTLVYLGKWADRLFRGHLEPAWGYSAFLFLGGAALAILAGALMMIRPGKPAPEGS